MESMTMTHRCPACGYDGLFEEPWNDESASDEICPSCGIHFGYDDAKPNDPSARAMAQRAWRKGWITNGMTWFSQSRRPPDGWNPEEQLRRLLENPSQQG